jgi:hypothetical protein
MSYEHDLTLLSSSKQWSNASENYEIRMLVFHDPIIMNFISWGRFARFYQYARVLLNVKENVDLFRHMLFGQLIECWGISCLLLGIGQCNALNHHFSSMEYSVLILPFPIVKIHFGIRKILQGRFRFPSLAY